MQKAADLDSLLDEAQNEAERAFGNPAVFLERYIPRVMEAKKDQRLYARLLKVFRPCNVGFMIGDQLERDIRPAKVAGLSTIYFPSNFRPKWDIEQKGALADHQITTFAGVPAIIDNVLRIGR